MDNLSSGRIKIGDFKRLDVLVAKGHVIINLNRTETDRSSIIAYEGSVLKLDLQQGIRYIDMLSDDGEIEYALLSETEYSSPH